jgi:hypothetical protein
MGAALTTTMGELVLLLENLASPGEPTDSAGAAYRAELDNLLRLRQRCPALCAGGARRALRTSDDARFYAFWRGEPGGEQALAVFNFQPSPQEIGVDLRGEQVSALEDLFSGELTAIDAGRLSLRVPAYGFAIFRVRA